MTQFNNYLGNLSKYKNTKFSIGYTDEGSILLSHDNYERRLDEEFTLELYSLGKENLEKELFDILIVSYDYLGII